MSLRLSLILLLLPWVLSAPLAHAQSTPEFPVNCQRAEETYAKLQSQFYQPVLGKWKKAIWWNYPNILQALIDETEVELADPKISPQQKKHILVERQKLVHSIWVKNKWKFLGGFRNLVNDDEMWWALASVRAFEFTGDRNYLSPVWKIFNDPKKTWGQQCSSGGVAWKWNLKYVSSYVNELFFLLSSRMSLIETNPARRAEYQKYAHLEYQWFFESPLIFTPSQEADYEVFLAKNGIPVSSRLLIPGLIADGLGTDCKSDFDRPWTYNQAVVLAALVAFAQVDPTLANEAIGRARSLAAVSTSAPSIQMKGALNEPPTIPSTSDIQMFKGIYSRDLSVLNEALSDHPYDSFYAKNAELAWKNAHDSDPTSPYYGQFNFNWGRRVPWGVGEDAPTATKQGTALALYLSACKADLRH